MPNHLSILGIIHTAISILAILVALYALYKDGKINPATSPGKLYILLTVITCITGFPIMRFGHPTPGHYLGVIILVLLALGVYAKRISGKARAYIQLILLSTTVFLSFIPAIVETSTRLPMGHPLAAGPDDPLVQKAQLVLLAIFLIGVIYQVIKLGTNNKNQQI
ncbi:hypothetical protein [Mucilaginibacter gotjawali]|uniref:Uncharacterized protein n=2 Tax=Mucilaginibacter gotjawali TaxID=1550579 RepID=A0A0X8X1C6_9SPHI|nr:hypothetical protein [Mucilaginibacter gotjawali]MBB3053746.1 hypothetical protein [Mucilaginibacter gotjawali]BAU54006.1 hypothetical protein MgSA37_02177 [Mucilaginibacter gotjawali]